MHVICFEYQGQTYVGRWDTRTGTIDIADEIPSPEAVNAWIAAQHGAEGHLKPIATCHRDDVTLLAPVPAPQKVICIGRNYADHASEMGSAVGDIPVVFNKFPSCVCGPDSRVAIPEISTSVDYEAELVVVIGTTTRNVSPANSLAHVFGYTCGNDLSARDWQKGRPGGQWLLGKAFDNFAPIGPAIATADALDAHSLNITCRVNGEQRQSSNTRQLIFKIDFLIAHLSQFCTLLPGDLIFTGTPAGVGAGFDPPRFLQPGDVVECDIEGIGCLTTTLV